MQAKLRWEKENDTMAAREQRAAAAAAELQQRADSLRERCDELEREHRRLAETARLEAQVCILII